MPDYIQLADALGFAAACAALAGYTGWAAAHVRGINATLRTARLVAADAVGHPSTFVDHSASHGLTDDGPRRRR